MANPKYNEHYSLSWLNYLTWTTDRLPAGKGFRRSASGRVRSSQEVQSSRLRITICLSWFGATSGPGSVGSSVNAASPPGIGRHKPAKQNQSSPVFVNFHLAFGDFFPVNS